MLLGDPHDILPKAMPRGASHGTTRMTNVALANFDVIGLDT